MKFLGYLLGGLILGFLIGTEVMAPKILERSPVLYAVSKDVISDAGRKYGFGIRCARFRRRA